MKLLVILICLATIRYIPLGRVEHRYRFLKGYAKIFYHLFKWLKEPSIIALLIYIPLGAVLFFLEFYLSQGWGIILKFIISLWIVWYSLWAISLHDEVESGIKAGRPSSSLLSELLSNANRHVLGVIFWYMIFGIAGALLYRLIVELTRWAQEEAGTFHRLVKSARRIRDLVDWIPVRLVGLGFLLVADFVEGVAAWMYYFFDEPKKNHHFLEAVGRGAMEIHPHTDIDRKVLLQSLKMVERSFIVWLIIIAIFTLGNII
jgi:membrane protein required for beta-lactamase induction